VETAMKTLTMLAAVAMVSALAGCGTEQFRTQPLGTVDYNRAFQATRASLQQYFSIESADAGKGDIRTRWSRTGSERSGLVSSSPTRRMATVRLRKESSQVLLDIRVTVERQGEAGYRAMQPVTVNNEVPNRPPAVEGAAGTTSEQNQAWQESGRDEGLENKIVADVLRRLELTPTSRPTSQPAGAG
jgi:hypothetical protein